MGPVRRPAIPWAAAAGGALLTALALALVAALALGLQARHDVAAPGDRAARIAGSTPRLAATAPAVAAPRLASRAGGAVRILGPGGRIRAEAGPPALWARGGPPWASALATSGAGAWRMRAGAVEARAPLPGGGRVLVRAPLAPGVGGAIAATAAIAGGAILLLALLAGLGVAWALRARDRRLLRRAGAADALAAGRPAAATAEDGGAWRDLDAALARLAERTTVLQRAADIGFDGVGAVLGPMAHPVAARTPSGGRLRNTALEQLVDRLAVADARAVDEAVAAALGARGAVSRRIALSDGRVLEVDGWPASGGRVAAVGERTEQERLSALRLRLAGAAARHLHAPAIEIQSLGRELSTQVPASGARRLRRLLAAADRMERLVGRLLRGTPHDPRTAPPRLERLGTAGFLWGLAHEWDRALKRGALRMELEVDPDLPALRTDPALAEEILTELIDNAAKFTPRGGTVRLSARLSGEGGVAIEVGDTGPGLDPREVALAGERFYRGPGADALPGAGLGLGVAGALAERLGGRLTLEPGPGGRARLELPVAAAREPRAVSDAAEPARSAEMAGSRPG